MNSQGDEDEKHPVTKHHNRPQTRERATRLARGAGLAACARAALFTAAAADAGSWSQTRMKTARIAENSSGNLIHIIIRTNILERYYNEDVRLTLPEGKRVSRLKWFAVYDIQSQNAFADVYVPEDFAAPAPLAAGALAGQGVTSGALQLLDAGTILRPVDQTVPAPAPLAAGALAGQGVTSAPLQLLDAGTILRPDRTSARAARRRRLAGQGVTSAPLQLLEAGTILPYQRPRRSPPAPWPDRASPARPYSCWTLAPYCEWTSRPVDQTVPAPAPLAAGALAGQGVTSAPLQLLDAGTILPYQRPRRSPPAPWPDRASPARPYSCWTLAPYCEWTSRPVDQTVPAPAPLAAGALAGQGVTSAPYSCWTLAPYCEWTSRPVDQTVPAPAPLAAGALAGQGVTSAPLQLLDAGTILRPVDQTVPAPAPLAAGSLAGRGVTSAPLQLLDAGTILIPELHYDGHGEEVYFWAGVGPQPSPRGFKIPDEYGYLEPIPTYRGGAVRLVLPGNQTVFSISWLALWDAAARSAIAAVLLPSGPTCRRAHRPAPAQVRGAGGALGGPPPAAPSPPCCCPSGPTCRPRSQTCTRTGEGGGGALGGPRPSAPSPPCCCQRPNVPPALTDLHPHRGAGALGGAAARSAIAAVLLPGGPTCRPRSQTCTRTGEGGGGRWGGPPPAAPSPPCCCPSGPMPPALTDLHPHRGGGGAGGAAARSAIAAVLLPERPNVPPALTDLHPHSAIAAVLPRAAQRAARAHRPAPAQVRGGGGALGGGRRRSAIAAVLLPERPTCARAHRPAPAQVRGGAGGRWGGRRPQRHRRRAAARAAQRAARAHRPAPAQVRGGGALGGAAARSAIAAVLLPERPNVPPALTDLHPHSEGGGRGGAGGGRRPQRHRRRAAARAAQRAARAHRPAPAQVRGGGGALGGPPRSAIAAVLLPERPNVPPALTDLHPPQGGGGGLGGGRRRSAIAAVLLPERPNVRRPRSQTCTRTGGAGGAGGGAARSAIAAVLLPERPQVRPRSRPAPAQVRGGGGALGGPPPAAAIAAVLLPERPNVPPALTDLHPHTGPLCVAEHPAGADRRRDTDYDTFRAFNRSLVWRCDPDGAPDAAPAAPAAPASPATLAVAPNDTWPDVVYYNSFTHAVTLFSNYDSPIFNSKFPSKNFNAAIREKYSVTTSQQNKGAGPKTRMKTARIAENSSGNLIHIIISYDGTGDDTFFWAGDSARPGPQGFIVPDHHGKTNILERYYNEDVRLTLPEGKRVSRLKWFAVYDIQSQNAFADVYVPEDFAAPAPLAAGALAGQGVTSAPLQLLDAGTILPYQRPRRSPPAPWPDRASPARPYSCWTLAPYCEWTSRPVDQTVPAPAPLAAGALAGQGVTSAPLQLLDAGTILPYQRPRRSPPAPWPDRASPARPYSCWTLAPYCEWTSRPVDQTVPAPAPLAAGALAGQGVTSAPYSCWTLAPYCEWTVDQPYQRPRRSPPAPWPDRASPARPYSCWTLAPYCEWTSRPVDQTVPAPAPLAAGALAGQGVTSAPLQLLDAGTILPYQRPRRSRRRPGRTGRHQRALTAAGRWHYTVSGPVDSRPDRTSARAARRRRPGWTGRHQRALQLLDAGTILPYQRPRRSPPAPGRQGVTSAPYSCWTLAPYCEWTSRPVDQTVPAPFLFCILMSVFCWQHPGAALRRHGEEVYFWAGVARSPRRAALRSPTSTDTDPYVPRRRRAAGAAGNQTVFSISWLALWDAARPQRHRRRAAAERPNVPPALTDLHPPGEGGRGGAGGGRRPQRPSPPCCCPSGQRAAALTDLHRTGEGGRGALGGPPPAAPSPPCCCRAAQRAARAHRPAPAQVRGGGGGGAGGPPPAAPSPPCCCPSGPTCRPRSQTCTRTGEGGGGALGGPPPAAPSPPCCCRAAQRAARAHRPAPAQVRGGGALGGPPPAAPSPPCCCPSGPTCRPRSQTCTRTGGGGAGGGRWGAAARSAIAAVLLPSGPTCRPRSQTCTRTGEGGGGALGGAAARSPSPPCCCPSGPTCRPRSQTCTRTAPLKVFGNQITIQLAGKVRTLPCSPLRCSATRSPYSSPGRSEHYPVAPLKVFGNQITIQLAGKVRTLPCSPLKVFGNQITIQLAGSPTKVFGNQITIQLAGRSEHYPVAPLKVFGNQITYSSPEGVQQQITIQLAGRSEHYPVAPLRCSATRSPYSSPEGSEHYPVAPLKVFGNQITIQLAGRCSANKITIQLAGKVRTLPCSPTKGVRQPDHHTARREVQNITCSPLKVFGNQITIQLAGKVFGNQITIQLAGKVRTLPCSPTKGVRQPDYIQLAGKVRTLSCSPTKGVRQPDHQQLAGRSEHYPVAPLKVFGNQITIQLAGKVFGNQITIQLAGKVRKLPCSPTKGVRQPDHHTARRKVRTLPVAPTKVFSNQITIQLAGKVFGNQSPYSSPGRSDTLPCSPTKGVRQPDHHTARREGQKYPVAPLKVFGNQITIQLAGKVFGNQITIQLAGKVEHYSVAPLKVFGNQITIQLAGKIDEREYMAFGISGSDNRSLMLGADVAVAHFDARLQRGLATDYNITALAPVTESIDRAFPLDRPLLAVWAVGALDAAGEPGFHRLWPRTDLFDPSLRVFEFRVGPAGGARAPPGARALRGAPPEPGVRRQQPALCGGVPPADSERGPARRTGTAAGGRPARRQAGPLCVAEHPAGADRRRDTDYDTFRAFNRSLVWRCDPDGAPAAPAAPASPATLAVAPNDTWPDVVYYNSFTHAGMGGRIFVVDRHRRNINRKGSGAAPLLAAPSPPRRARGPRRLDLPRPLDCHSSL
ncbi:LOW QUALITY PROTEIN: hypothetical protein MSG28_014030 [Choristoneura fumiferana]|uniref:Uncharacterized protein n=1 Tax=Choristoneura fumiferana TaxID=7141 RepID=A0ACC0JFL3_CHOFU|nr:LOW QUALITY PROTEIN: hypothetical protein MSG28_014030 [Choristoneura fumiferana]